MRPRHVVSHALPPVLMEPPNARLRNVVNHATTARVWALRDPMCPPPKSHLKHVPALGYPFACSSKRNQYRNQLVDVDEMSGNQEKPIHKAIGRNELKPKETNTEINWTR